MDLELEDQIFQVKQIIPGDPSHSVLNVNSRVDKKFQRGLNISEIFVLGVLSIKLKVNYLLASPRHVKGRVQIFQYI